MTSTIQQDWQHPLYSAEPDEVFAVIGGEGFLGSTIIQALRAAYPSNSTYSLGPTRRSSAPSSYFHADITSSESILSALRSAKATTVFHTASPHHDAALAICEKVNVVGTQCVVDACRASGVRKLVFTSSMTVVCDGCEIIDGDERMPYTERRDDPYVATKVKAERIVLDANGQDGLLTCSLRLSGVFGPGDRQAMQGFIGVLKAGQTAFQVGDGRALFDWVHSTNVVHAHLLAAAALSRPSPGPEEFFHRLRPFALTLTDRPLPTSTDPFTPIAIDPLPAHRTQFDAFRPPVSPARLSLAGQAVLITNGEPLPFWSFARAVWFAYNGHVPPFVVPLPKNVAMALAHSGTSAYKLWNWITGRRDKFMLAPAHVQWTTQNLYWNIEKARRVLGYEPIVSLADGIQDAVESYKREEARLSEEVEASKGKKDL